MKQSYVTKDHFDKTIELTNEKINKILENVDWLVGAYKKFDEEHTILSDKVSNHSDKLDKIEETLRIQVN
jgi:hypothetical protein